MNVESIDSVRAKIVDIEGWLTAGQTQMLFDAARQVAAGGRIVEIGSFRGRSTVVLASAAAPGVEVVAIDPHAGNDRGPQEIEGFAAAAADDHEVFRSNLAAAGVWDRVRHLRAFSSDALDAVDAPISLLYVDGAHRFGPARADIRDWGAKVEAGGVLLIHDSFSSIGVTLAILRELCTSRRWRYVGRSRSMTMYRADLPERLSARVANTARQIAQLPWFAKNVLLKVALTVRLGGVMRRLTGRTPEWPY